MVPHCEWSYDDQGFVADFPVPILYANEAESVRIPAAIRPYSGTAFDSLSVAVSIT